MIFRRTAGPAHRTDGGDDSPDDVKLREESKDPSPTEMDSPPYKRKLFDDCEEKKSDFESLALDEENHSDGVEQAPEMGERVLIPEEDSAGCSSPRKTNSTTHNSGASSDDDDGTVVQENIENSDRVEAEKEKCKDIRFLAFILIVIFILILIAGCFLLFFFVRDKSTEKQLEELGFPFRKDMKDGWLFDANTDTAAKSYRLYNSTHLGKDADEVGCATKCASVDAFAGAWNTFYQECWCFLEVPNSNYCFERCLIEEGIEFSSVQLQPSFQWCPKSYCQIFEDAQGYCDSRPMRNVTDCVV